MNTYYVVDSGDNAIKFLVAVDVVVGRCRKAEDKIGVQICMCYVSATSISISQDLPAAWPTLSSYLVSH